MRKFLIRYKQFGNWHDYKIVEAKNKKAAEARFAHLVNQGGPLMGGWQAVKAVSPDKAEVFTSRQ